MESILVFFQSTPTLVLFGLFIFSLMILGRSAELIVDIAVILSLKLNISRLIIGATVISLGTTLPEVCVSVLASLQGKGSMALGNAVGSIICDTALILGVVSLVARIPVSSSLVNRQAWLQLGAGFLLIVASLNGWSYSRSLEQGGHLSQLFGFLALLLLLLYLYSSVRMARTYSPGGEAHIEFDEALEKVSMGGLSLRFLVACLLLGVASEVLILSASEMAVRFEVPQSVIAVTMLALGTSVPELVTSIVAVRKGFGEIALGNIIGADILNVLLVAGASVAFSPAGFVVDKSFFSLSFPIMITALLVLRVGILFSKDYLHKSVGSLLVFLYILFSALNLKDFF